jgi:beta-lactamase superfamily II metal-dependent hydrolase
MGPYIYTFEVGQGDCHVILLNREAIVIDAGPAGSPILSFLKRFGYRVKCLILTHNDADHSAGAFRLLVELGRSGRIDSFGSLQDRAPNATANRTIALAMELYEKQLIRRLWRLEIDREAKIVAQLGGTHTLSLLHPTYHDNLAGLGQHERRPTGPNRTSAVLRLCDVSGTGLGLWSGDLPAEAWEVLLTRINCRAQWFVAPHHGSGSGWSTPSISAVLNAVDPAWMVVSVGSVNRYGHPSSDWIKAATARKTRAVCTQLTLQCHRRLGSLGGPSSLEIRQCMRLHRMGSHVLERLYTILKTARFSVQISISRASRYFTLLCVASDQALICVSPFTRGWACSG